MTLVLLGVMELVALAWWLLPHASSAAQIGIGVAYLSSLLFWLPVVTSEAIKGTFLRYSRLFSTLIAFNIPIALSVLLWHTVTPFHSLVESAAADAGSVAVVGVHGLRLAAAGTFNKVKKGELPAHFGWLGAAPDFAFACTVPVVATLVSTGAISGMALAGWHLAGITVFLGAGVGMYLTVESPLKIYDSQPDSADVFRWPLVLAPGYTVPLFAVLHLFGIRVALGM